MTATPVTEPDDEGCICPRELVRELDQELRKYDIVLPSLRAEQYGGVPMVHFGGAIAETAQELLNVLRKR